MGRQFSLLGFAAPSKGVGNRWPKTPLDASDHPVQIISPPASATTLHIKIPLQLQDCETAWARPRIR